MIGIAKKRDLLDKYILVVILLEYASNPQIFLQFQKRQAKTFD